MQDMFVILKVEQNRTFFFSETIMTLTFCLFHAIMDAQRGDDTMELNNRQKMILQKLNQLGQIRVSDLSKEFYFSEMTIRRDLEKLEKRGCSNASTAARSKTPPFFSTRSTTGSGSTRTRKSRWRTGRSNTSKTTR